MPRVSPGILRSVGSGRRQFRRNWRSAASDWRRYVSRVQKRAVFGPLAITTLASMSNLQRMLQSSEGSQAPVYWIIFPSGNFAGPFLWVDNAVRSLSTEQREGSMLLTIMPSGRDEALLPDTFTSRGLLRSLILTGRVGAWTVVCSLIREEDSSLTSKKPQATGDRASAY